MAPAHRAAVGHGQNCMEYLELNFGADKESQAQTDARAEQPMSDRTETRVMRPPRHGTLP